MVIGIPALRKQLAYSFSVTFFFFLHQHHSRAWLPRLLRNLQFATKLTLLTACKQSNTYPFSRYPSIFFFFYTSVSWCLSQLTLGCSLDQSPANRGACKDKQKFTLILTSVDSEFSLHLTCMFWYFFENLGRNLHFREGNCVFFPHLIVLIRIFAVMMTEVA